MAVAKNMINGLQDQVVGLTRRAIELRANWQTEYRRALLLERGYPGDDIPYLESQVTGCSSSPPRREPMKGEGSETEPESEGSIF